MWVGGASDFIAILWWNRELGTMKEEDCDNLLFLLKASSKDVVIRLCNEAFLHRNSAIIPDDVKKSVVDALGISKSESSQLMKALVSLIKAAVFQGSTEPAQILTLFPGNFHKNLRDLLGKIIIENLPSWKSQAINDKVSLARLVDFDWRVDIKTSSDTISRMAVPTCILQLRIEDTKTHINQEAKTSAVNVELSKETLDTMLDGLGKIRDQLSSVAKK